MKRDRGKIIARCKPDDDNELILNDEVVLTRYLFRSTKKAHNILFLRITQAEILECVLKNGRGRETFGFVFPFSLSSLASHISLT